MILYIKFTRNKWIFLYKDEIYYMYSKTCIINFFIDILPEILRKLNQIFAKLSSIEGKLFELEEKGNSCCTHRNKEMISVLQEFVSLPLKSNEEVQNMEKDLEDKEFFEQMVSIY